MEANVSAYHIYLLGPLYIEKDGEALPALRTQKTVALFGYLLRQKQPVPRSYLAHLFWGDLTEERGRRNLSNELSHISSQLPGLFETDRQTIQFVPSENVWLDTAAFEAIIKEQPTPNQPPNQPSNLSEAIALYRSDFLTGCTLNDSPDFETWLLSEQEYFRRQVVEALDQLITSHLEQGEESLAEGYARQWLTLEPWREEAHRRLMMLLARNGQRSAALAQYETCRRVLEEELAVEPAPETQALYEQIRVGALTSSVPTQVAPAMGSSNTPEATANLATTPQMPTSPSPPLTSERRNQLILLNKVKNFWVKGVMEQALQSNIRLGMARQMVPEMVEQPWEQIVAPLTRKHQIPPDKQMLDLFAESDRALLILGKPGAGKTMTLIDLARELIALAEYDPTQPIPVILNLATWSQQRPPLTDWIVSELTIKYQIPAKMGTDWLEQNDLVLLLDGLDEVDSRYQTDVVETINALRKTNGLSGIVVCSRAEVYANLEPRLHLGGAIKLLPLNIEQIDTFLAEAGPQLSFLRVALQREAEYEGQELREVLDSPLMLSVIRLAYDSDEASSDIPAEARAKRSRSETRLLLQANQDQAVHRHHLFAAYVERMFERRRGNALYSTQQTTSWLSWLAQKLFQHNQSVFLIERMQPSWLPSRSERWLYLLSTRAIEAIGIGLLIWALIFFWQPRAPEIVSKAVGLVTAWLPWQGAGAMLFGGLLIAQALSLVVTLFDGLYYEWLDRTPDFVPSKRHQLLRHLGVAALAGGLPFLVILALSPEVLGVALYWAANGFGGYALLSYFAHGDGFQDEIKAVESLGWSWLGAVKGGLLSLIPGAILQVVATQFNAAFVGIALTWLVSFMIVGGLRGQATDTKSVPNQGIKLAVKNSLFAAVIGGLAFALVLGATVGLEHGLRFGLVGFLLWGSFYGGGHIVKHYTLRFLLWRNGHLPWQYSRFLDYAAQCIFLRRVGGGYIFIHQLLQAYFANLASDTSSSSAPTGMMQKKVGAGG